MNSVVHSSKLTAPGRMDVVEKVIKGDPFFITRMRGPSEYGRKNRRGIQKRYSALTVGIVMSLAQAGIDAVNMRREEIIAKAFEYCQLGADQTTLAA